MLGRLGFDMHVETPRHFVEFLLLFLRRRAKIAPDLMDRVTRVARYLSELASRENGFAASPPSLLSFANVSVALSARGVRAQPVRLFAELLPLPFSDDSLRTCATKMRTLLEKASLTRDQLLERHGPLPPLYGSNGKEEAFCGKGPGK